MTTALVLTLLTDCQTLPAEDTYDTPNSKIPVGSSIQLYQSLRYNKGYCRSFSQSGKAVTYKQINQRYPYCLLYRYEPPEELLNLRTMQADSFSVT